MVGAKEVRQALYERLNHASITSLLTDGSAGIRHAVARPETRFPFLLINRQSDTPILRFGGPAFQNEVWLVKAVDRGTKSSVAEDIASAVADRLDFQQLTVSGASFMFMARLSGVDYVETEGDQHYRHHGALYRISVQD